MWLIFCALSISEAKKSTLFCKLDWSVFMWKGGLLERASLYQSGSFSPFHVKT